jgi:hypothetical protein
MKLIRQEGSIQAVPAFLTAAVWTLDREGIVPLVLPTFSASAAASSSRLVLGLGALCAAGTRGRLVRLGYGAQVASSEPHSFVE